MKLQKYIIPVFVSANLLAQHHEKLFPEIKLGITHSGYLSGCFSSSISTPNFDAEQVINQNKINISETQFGFALGLFLWMPLNDKIVFKPRIDGCFSNSCLKQNHSVYSTSFDLNFLHGFVIALKQPDKNGIIYLARNMSCYLQSKQPYLLIGPKLNLKKYDKGFLKKGFENELNFGFLIGYGINYVFQGRNFAPEISYCICSSSQNKLNNSNKITHTISFTINFF